MNIESIIERFFKKPLPQPTEKSVFEQQKEIIDEAEEFDRLAALPAWSKALHYLAARVNDSIVEATTYKEDPAKMMWAVARWDAQRELLDDLQAHIASVINERDRIVAEIKERQDAGLYGN